MGSPPVSRVLLEAGRQSQQPQRRVLARWHLDVVAREVSGVVDDLRKLSCRSLGKTVSSLVGLGWLAWPRSVSRSHAAQSSRLGPCIGARGGKGRDQCTGIKKSPAPHQKWNLRAETPCEYSNGKAPGGRRWRGRGRAVARRTRLASTAPGDSVYHMLHRTAASREGAAPVRVGASGAADARAQAGGGVAATWPPS